MTAHAGPAPAPVLGRPALTAAAVAGVCAVWAAAVWTAVHLTADPLLHDVALFAHLASLVVGFGAVLTVDWLGLLWLLGRRPLPEVLRTADAVHLPIWLGLAGLVGSGVLLHPDPGSPLTQVKLGLVLLVALNGVHAWTLGPALAALSGPRGADAPGDAPGAPVSRALTARCASTVLVSQLGWWGATVIGFLNSRH
ncbi:hypothetical protein M1P56_31325 [Streptomyces sp. HU2014]|uniref:Copper resistance protein D domain-containing protein n=1 Tax=Streptomyces albireticuli TaxID=1940 RepID=A0A1Z2L2P0_9ACTN|nr:MULTISPECIES: hypothetical protein [Streptomyces]ARZ68555.1 hypothetical protein SMD11_2908 [Streptomyces albireticuli]UQI48493.1 hypothetical protein M1P56_31325 [Streptomyces sp. HU2014]